VRSNFTILILPLSGTEIIIDVTRLVVGAVLIEFTCTIVLIEIVGKLRRGRKLGHFIVATRSSRLGVDGLPFRACLNDTGGLQRRKSFYNGVCR
jgi:hypothetical protein